MDLLPNPIEQLRVWFAEAERACSSADVVALATASAAAVPSALMSQQSRELDSFESMDKRVDELRLQYDGQPIPRPSYWGGTLLHPERIEFRVSREHRRHYRWEFERFNSDWRQRRLYP